MKRLLLTVLLSAVLVAAIACGRFSNPANDAKAERVVVISQTYNEIIWALGAQGSVVARVVEARASSRRDENGGKQQC